MAANIDELNITISADATKAMEEIKRLADQLKKLKGRYSNLASSAKEAGNAAKTASEAAKKSADAAKQASKQANDAAKAAEKASKSVASGMSKGMDAAAKAAEKSKKTITDIGKGMPQIEFDFSGLDATKDQIKAAMKEAQRELPRLVAEYGAEDAVNIAKNRARVMAQQLSEGLRTLNASHATGRTKEDIERDAQREAEWKAKADARQAERFRKREEKFQRYAESWKARNGGASAQVNNSVPQISRTTEALNKLKVVAGGVRKALSPANLSPYNMSKGIVSGVGTAIGAFRRLIGTIPNVNYAISKGLVSGVGKLGGLMGRAGGAVGSFVWSLTKIHAAGTAAVTLGVLARMTRTVSSGFKTLAKAAGSVPFKIFSAGAKVATGAVSRLKDAFKNVGKSSDGSSKALRNIQRATLSAVVGVRSVFSLIRRIRKSIGESLEDLAKYSSDVDKTIGGLKGSLNQLSDSFATAFEPILTAVAPYIRQLIDWVISGINAVNQFFSALSGRSTWTKATFHMESIASGANDAASGTSAANDAAKEYQRTLMGFDKINKLESPFDSGSGGGSGGGGSGSGGADATGGTFTTEEISTGVKDFVTMVKEAWQNADFTDVGRVIGEKLADALNKIPWDKVKTAADKFGTSFATLINGLVSVTELATALGTTIGESINTIFTAANAFVSNLNFGAVGAFFAEVMNSGIDTVDWDLIADTLSKAANGVFNLAGTWANRFKFDALGTNIGSTITTALDKIEWEDAEAACVSIGDGIATALNSAFKQKPLTAVGDAISNALSAIFSGVNSFVSGVSYGTVGEDLADGLSKIVQNKTLWENVASILSTTANGVFTLAATWADKFDFDALGTEVGNTITSVMTGLEWEDAEAACKKLGKGVADTINAIVKEKPLTAVATAVGKAINAAIAGLDDFLTETSWKAVGQEIADSINEFFSTFDFTKAGVTVGNAMNSLLTLFNNAVKGVSWGEVGSKVMSAIKGFFSTFEWSGISGALSNIAEALYDFFTGAVSSVDWSGVPGAIADAIKGIITGADFQGVMQSYGSFLGAVFAAGLNLGEAIYNKLKDGALNIGEYFAKYITEAGYDQDAGLMANGVAIITGIFNGIGNFMLGIGEWIETNIVTPFMTGFAEKFGINGGADALGRIGEEAKKIGTGILHGIAEGVKNIGEWIQVKLIDPMYEKILNAIPSDILSFLGINKEVELEMIAKRREGFDESVEMYVSVEDSEATKDVDVKTTSDFRDIAGMYNSLVGGEVTKDVNVEKGPIWNPDAVSAINRVQGEKTEVTLEQNVVQGPQWIGDAVDAMKKLGGKVVNTLEENVIKGSVWNPDAVSAMNRVQGEKVSSTLQQNVSKGPTWVDAAVEAAKKTGGTIVNTLKQNLAKGSTWSPEAYTAANREPGETRTSTLKQNVTKGGSWIDEAVSLAKKVGGTVTSTLKQNVDKGTWDKDAYSAANRVSGEKRTSTLTQNLAKGTGANWNADAYNVTKIPAHSTSSKSLSVAYTSNDDSTRKDGFVSIPAFSSAKKSLSVAYASAADSSRKDEFVKVPAYSTSSKSLAFSKDKSFEDQAVKDYISMAGKSTLGTVTKTLNAVAKKLDDQIPDEDKKIKTTALFKKDFDATNVEGKNIKMTSLFKKDFDASHVEGKDIKMTALFKKDFEDKHVSGESIEMKADFNNKTTKNLDKNVTGMVSQFNDWDLGRKFNTTVTNMIVKFTGWTKTSFKWPWQNVTVTFSGSSEIAEGGSFYDGSWHKIPQYAAGGSPSHGSMFIAGEKGAEVVGHINGRTEVLNQSQMASTMYAAVYGAMMAAAANSPNGAVNVYLQGDAKGLFKAVQAQANMYTQMTGQPAFNL